MTKFNNLAIKTLSLLNFSLTEKILNSIFSKQVDRRNSINIDSDDICLMAAMMKFLFFYDGNSIIEDFYSKFTNTNKEIEFYIYFIFLYMKWTRGKNIYSDLFLNNINKLFYLNDIEYKYNPEKFKLHYSYAFLDDLSIDDNVSSELINYVDSNLPSNLDTDIEKAIAIYVLLSKILTYSPLYTLHEDISEINGYQNVNLINTDVVCVQFSIIYHKILSLYGIDSNLAGDINTHMYVNLNFGNMMIRADATRYGYYEDRFDLSDMTNLKYNFLIEGFKIYPVSYSDPSYVKYGEYRLNNIIKNVYCKMSIPLDLKERLNEYIFKVQGREFDISKTVDKEQIDTRIGYLNNLPLIINGTVEETQFHNMMVLGVFFDIAEERLENVSFYKIENGKVILNKMVVVYDSCMQPYYYFFRNGKLVNYDVDTIVDIILDEGWLFKYKTDIDALYLDDDRIYKLMR